jgi:hypothetical protein
MPQVPPPSKKQKTFHRSVGEPLVNIFNGLQRTMSSLSAKASQASSRASSPAPSFQFEATDGHRANQDVLMIKAKPVPSPICQRAWVADYVEEEEADAEARKAAQALVGTTMDASGCIQMFIHG